MIIAPVGAIGELFASAAARDYLGEPVTVAAHLLQAAALAEAAAAPAPLVAAALLHDIGHLPLPLCRASQGPVHDHVLLTAHIAVNNT